MRHLHFIARGTAPLTPGFAPGLTQSGFMTLARVASIIALMTFAIPLRAQKSATAPAKKSQAKSSPTKVSQPKTGTQQPAQISGAAEGTVAAPLPANDSYNMAVTTALLDAPESAVIAQLKKGTNVAVIARDRGWTQVRLEGWVPDSLLTPADTAYRAGLSAADLRADPAATRGLTVIWNVEFLALQTADPLRHGLVDEEPYILARGPKSENALLYLVVPPSLMGTARALQPLEKIVVTARVRDGRSEPVGVPILDIQTIRRIR